MRATFKLFNAYFWKTIYGPVIAFVFPTLLLAILGKIMKIEYVFPGIVAMTSMFIAVQAMPLGIMEMKNSTLFKYIGASPVNPLRFSFSIIAYYIFIDFFAILLLMLMTLGFYPQDVLPSGGVTQGIFSGIFTFFGMFSFMVSNLFHIALGLAIGLTIATFSKTPQQALTIGLIIVIPSMFLSGMVISVDIIAQSKTMQWISMFIPFRYTTGNIVVSSTPLNQMGDYFQQLSVQELSIIFKNVDAKNHLVTIGGNSISNVDQLMRLYNTMNSAAFNNDLSDVNLFNLLFVDGHAEAMTGSSNNLFNITSEFGVRKFPDVDSVSRFIKAYLSGVAGKEPNINIIRILNDQVADGSFAFMDIFFKQTTNLYKVYDKVLNFFVPLTLISILTTYVIKKFNWTSR